MRDPAPRDPARPLWWPDVVITLRDVVAAAPYPVYIVGGAVRDALLHRPLKDLDLAVVRGSIALGRQIADALDGDIYILDAEREVARVLVETPDGRLTIDVARFRGGDLAADLRDRDFTINAMAVDLRAAPQLLLDPLGGEQDALKRLIRRCAPHAMMDDPIRALRAVRQSVELDARIEAATRADIRAAVGRLADTSPERVRDEFIKLLALPKAASGLRAAERLGLLRVVIPALADGDSARAFAVVDQLARILTAVSPQRSDNTAASFAMGVLVMQLDRYRQRLLAHLETRWADERPHRALLTLVALLSERGADTVRRSAASLRLSNAEKGRLAGAVVALERFQQISEVTPLALHRFWYASAEAGVDGCLLALAGFLAAQGTQLDHEAWLAEAERARALLEAYYERHAEVVMPPPVINGSDLVARLRLKPGPVVGELLTVIREGQVTGAVGSADDALRVAREYLAEHVGNS